MTTMAHALTDSRTMLRRQLLHLRRYPSLTGMLIGMPVIFLLLFVYVFGGAVGTAIGGGRAEYVNYLTPGILLFTVAGAAAGPAISVATDMTEGIVDRFRSMAIARGSLLTGHVLGSLVQNFLAVLAVLGVALLIGFRPNATPIEWLAVFGVLLATAFALTWFAVALGIVADSVETASNTPMFLSLLPFLGSGFVPTETMPAGLRAFAEHQPFTPIIETLRGLLLGTGIGSSGIVALAWCAGISLASYLWAKRKYNARTTR
ncbi:ABC transporter permease [Actinoplanes aureus]|jgi:ABC-2 type transport system permease protein|uniref:Transport permease protein n=1 Tax=Actinoplanes aureus TaxID=2792083 RepID=A0A931CGC6_9ACTN|nr:ABC transporter permease [Actinoplanes aureus]MBG0566753.1 ABC transporter permease [Actinoplanes aureus]